MNLLDTIITAVVTVVATVGPVFLSHHAKLKAAADILAKIVDAAEGKGKLPEISTKKNGTPTL